MNRPIFNWSKSSTKFQMLKALKNRLEMRRVPNSNLNKMKKNIKYKFSKTITRMRILMMATNSLTQLGQSSIKPLYLIWWAQSPTKETRLWTKVQMELSSQTEMTTSSFSCKNNSKPITKAFCKVRTERQSKPSRSLIWANNSGSCRQRKGERQYPRKGRAKVLKTRNTISCLKSIGRFWTHQQERIRAWTILPSTKRNN